MHEHYTPHHSSNFSWTILKTRTLLFFLLLHAASVQSKISSWKTQTQSQSLSFLRKMIAVIVNEPRNVPQNGAKNASKIHD